MRKPRPENERPGVTAQARNGSANNPNSGIRIGKKRRQHKRFCEEHLTPDRLSEADEAIERLFVGGSNLQQAKVKGGVTPTTPVYDTQRDDADQGEAAFDTFKDRIYQVAGVRSKFYFLADSGEWKVLLGKSELEQALHNSFVGSGGINVEELKHHVAQCNRLCFAFDQLPGMEKGIHRVRLRPSGEIVRVLVRKGGQVS
jgi:hypothetical protein